VGLNWRSVRLFLRLSRAHFLLGGLLLFGLGASIARYLGVRVDTATYLLGQGLVTSIQAMTHFLNEYFDERADEQNDTRTLFSGGSGAVGEGKLPRRVALQAALVTLALIAIFTSLLLRRGEISLLAWSLALLGFAGAFFYAAPPLRLIGSGYGELVASVVVAGLVPAFAFALFTGRLHRLLVMSAAPLIALHFAMIIALELPDYACDMKFGKRTLMVRLGWQAAMRMHDTAILLAVLLLLLAYLNGLPSRVALGSLIALPLALAQIWQMNRIRLGYPARWRVFTAGAVALFGLTLYLEMIGYILS